ncbi:MAG: light-harvesting antenna LH1, alpha subunit [Pseudomonadota bacterium]
MHKVWMMIHPMRALTVLYIFLALLAFMIHFILMSTERYNWFDPKPNTLASSQLVSSPVVKS